MATDNIKKTLLQRMMDGDTAFNSDDERVPQDRGTDAKVTYELVGRCFAARTAMHVAHLKSTNYSEHVALGDFYDAIAGLADGFIECHMGSTGTMATIPVVTPDQSAAPTAFLSSLRTWVVTNRSEAANDSTELENIIDEIIALIDRTSYKLRFLK